MSSRSKDREYRKWRVRIIRRDKRCILCGSIKCRTAHHLNCWRYFPEERYNTDNGVCLCCHCHSKFHNEFKGGYRRKCTKKDFDRFVRIIEYVKEKM